MAKLGILAAAIIFAFATTTAIADAKQARVDYLIHCQGCHLPEAVGVPGYVPRINKFLGYFMHSKAGREFIVQVPGASTANLSDARLAELINWLLLTYSEEQLPADFEPYTAEEISWLRPNLQADPESARKAILSDIAKTVPTLAKELETLSDY